MKIGNLKNDTFELLVTEMIDIFFIYHHNK